MNKKWKEICKEGYIISRLNIEDETCFYSKFFAIYRNLQYECDMKNGEVIKLTKLGEV